MAEEETTEDVEGEQVEPKDDGATEEPRRVFASIKCRPSKPGVACSWTESGQDEAVTRRMLDCPDPASDGLCDAFYAFTPRLKALMGWPETHSKCVFTGLSFKRGKEGDVSISMAGCNWIAGFDSPVNFQIPYQVPNAELRVLMDELEFRANGYLDGQRSQLSLFDGAEDENEDDIADEDELE